MAAELYNRALQMQNGRPSNMIRRNQRAKNSRVDHLISAAAQMLVRNKAILTNGNIYDAVESNLDIPKRKK